jgi:molybdopterin/thiamine biosynthesis adenylyltransferase
VSEIWFLKDLQRLDVEREAICNLEEGVDWLRGTHWLIDNSGKLCVEALIRVNEHDYTVNMVYPTLFPEVAPTVYPKNRTERWSTHQYLSGAFCLEWRPDTWHSDITGAQVLESAYTLLSIENPLGTDSHLIAPSQHDLSIGQILRASYGRYYTHSNLTTYLAELPSTVEGSVEFSVQWQSESFLIIIHSVQPHDLSAWEDESIPAVLRGCTDNQIKVGAFYKTKLTPENFSRIDCLQDLEVALEQAGYSPNELTNQNNIWADKTVEQLFGVLLTDAADNLHFFLKPFSSKGEVWKLALVQSSICTANPRLSTELQNLSSKSVGIVGLGSVGTKVASSLARTGVGRFYLVDDDIFLPENICRNDLDWRNVGEHKVDAVADVVSYISSFAQVEVSTINLGGQESSAALDSDLRQLSQCDILIDATANPRVFNLLAFIAKTCSKSLIWTEIFAGGIGGMIARSRPGKDPFPHVMKKVYSQYLTSEAPPFEGASSEQYALENSDGTILGASDAEVSILAGYLTRLVLDTLLERDPSLFPYSMYLVGLEQAWVFKAPFHTIPIDTNDLIYQESSEPVSPEVVFDSMAFLKELLEKMNDADPSA